jgi:PAS domain S-box-containing protein
MNTRILIVEDEALIAADLQSQLEDQGYSVPSIADNAEDAMRCVRRDQPALVLMDIRIRGKLNGIEAAALIRRTFHLPVIFVTAHADRETLEQAKITEPFGYIVKPFTGVNFRAQIETALWKHQMEHKLRVSEAWLSATVHSVADALIVTDAEGSVALMNAPAAKLTGWSPDGAKGKGLLEVFRLYDAKSGLPQVHPLESIRDGGELVAGTSTYRMKNPGGQDALVEAEISANRTADGELLGLVVVFRDVTERQEAEKRERQLQKMNAVALLATGLAGDLSKWQRRMDDSLARLVAETGSRRLHKILEEAYVCAGHQSSVVSQLALLAGTESVWVSEEVDLNEVLASLEVSFKSLLGSSRRLSLQLEPGIPAVSLDSEELTQNISRLLLSSRDAMPDGGTTEISTRTLIASDRTARVQISVKDSGKGFLPAAQHRVFDPYFQARRSTPHAGISLAMVYSFVARCGGFIEARADEGGAAYLMSFPASVNVSAPRAEVCPA